MAVETKWYNPKTWTEAGRRGLEHRNIQRDIEGELLKTHQAQVASALKDAHSNLSDGFSAATEKRMQAALESRMAKTLEDATRETIGYRIARDGVFSTAGGIAKSGAKKAGLVAIVAAGAVGLAAWASSSRKHAERDASDSISDASRSLDSVVLPEALPAGPADGRDGTYWQRTVRPEGAQSLAAAPKMNVMPAEQVGQLNAPGRA